jgi:hypothetical protein
MTAHELPPSHEQPLDDEGTVPLRDHRAMAIRHALLKLGKHHRLSERTVELVRWVATATRRSAWPNRGLALSDRSRPWGWAAARWPQDHDVCSENGHRDHLG